MQCGYAEWLAEWRASGGRSGGPGWQVTRSGAAHVIRYYSPGECYVTAGWETGLPRATQRWFVSRQRLPADEFEPRTARTDGSFADQLAVLAEGDA